MCPTPTPTWKTCSTRWPALSNGSIPEDLAPGRRAVSVAGPGRPGRARAPAHAARTAHGRRGDLPDASPHLDRGILRTSGPAPQPQPAGPGLRHLSGVSELSADPPFFFRR